MAINDILPLRPPDTMPLRTKIFWCLGTPATCISMVPFTFDLLCGATLFRWHPNGDRLRKVGKNLLPYFSSSGVVLSRWEPNRHKISSFSSPIFWGEYLKFLTCIYNLVHFVTCRKIWLRGPFLLSDIRRRKNDQMYTAILALNFLGGTRCQHVKNDTDRETSWHAFKWFYINCPQRGIALDGQKHAVVDNVYGNM